MSYNVPKIPEEEGKMFAFLAGLIVGAGIGYIICAQCTISKIKDDAFARNWGSKK